MKAIKGIKTEEQATYFVNKGRQHFCVNAKIFAKFVSGLLRSNHRQVVHEGCQNPRRHGSKFCLKCSQLKT